MFGTKSKQNQRTKKPESISNGNTNGQGTTCIIATGTRIEGKFSTTEDVRLDGTIVGEVRSDKRLVMGETGKIEGTVFCYESSIKGRIEGTISVKGLLHLLTTAYIKGKIKAKKMVIDEGASYNGECLIGEQHFDKEAVKN